MLLPCKEIYWVNEEVAETLKWLYSLNAGERVMTSTKLETTTIFQSVAERLQELGYHHTSGQCRAKFKREKIYVLRGA